MYVFIYLPIRTPIYLCQSVCLSRWLSVDLYVI